MKKKILVLTIAFVMLLSVFASCGGAERDQASNDVYYDAVSKSEAMDMPAVDMGFSSSYEKDVYYGIYETPETEAAVPDGTSFTEKIIKNVSISAESKEYDTALDGILKLVAKHKGYEESVSSSGRGYNASDYYSRYARLVLRIPAENLDAFLSEIGSLINVTSESSSVSNVTAEYYDTKARLEVLEAEKTAYEEMLKLAVNVEEVLMIKDRLYGVISEIEAKKTTLQVLDSKVSYSTVSIGLTEVREISTVPTPKTTFGEKISSAFTRSWKNFANNCGDFAIWFVSSIPTFVVLAIIIGVTLGVTIPAIKKKRRAKKNEKSE